MSPHPRFVYIHCPPDVVPYLDLERLRAWRDLLNWFAADEGYSVGLMRVNRTVDGSLLFYKVESPWPTAHAWEQAMIRRQEIGQATGILMERYKLSADAAFEVLRKLSQDTNRKLVDIAEHVRHTGELPTWRRVDPVS